MDLFLTLEKLELRTHQLEAYRYVEMAPLTPLEAMPGTLGRDEVYTVMPAVWALQGSFDLGDTFRGRDQYLWLRKELALPKAREGCQVVGLFDFGTTGGGNNSGFEALLYLNDKPYQGVDSNHMDVVLDDAAGHQVTLTFLLWSGLEGGGMKRELTHRINTAHIGYLHLDTDRFYYLSKAIVDTLRLLTQGAPEYQELITALNGAFMKINWDGEAFHATVSDALRALEASLKAIEPADKKITVEAVGHTHIDVAWLWRVKHTREKAQRSFATAIRLMEEFDDFLFLQTQPQLYQYLEEDCPWMYEAIRSRIREGRWEVDGGMWVEADCNLPGGEALVRQLMYGIAYFRERFGKSCEYLWLPDVFGYSWALPQILLQCNIKSFMTTKISWNQYNRMPHNLFWWKGIDGSRILTYFVSTPDLGLEHLPHRTTYNGEMTPKSVDGCWQKFQDKALSRRVLLSYGYGDGGGGVTRGMLKTRRAMDKLPGLPSVKTSTAGAFFRGLHESLQETEQYVHTWDGELYLEYHRGTYTSQGYNKRMNRSLEQALFSCEWLCAQAILLGDDYPQEELRACWEKVLLQQFHDIIPGSSIGEVYEDSYVMYEAAQKALHHLSGDACKSMVQPSEEAYTLLNPTSFDRMAPVQTGEKRFGGFYDTQGRALQAQRTDEGWLVQTFVPALSHTVIKFAADAPPPEGDAFEVSLQERYLETPFYSIQWDTDGRLISIYDKENKRQVLSEPGNRLAVYEDKPIGDDNWNIDIFYTEKSEPFPLCSNPILVEHGSLRCVIRFEGRYHRSRLTQDMVVYSRSRRIDFVTHADWHESDRLLRVSFPVDVRATTAAFDIQFGHVERPTHWNTSWDQSRFETMGHKWADISEYGYGVSLLNDCKYGYSAMDGVLGLSLLKSSKYPDPEADMGEHFFTYSLLPHKGSVIKGDTLQEAHHLNAPVRCVPGLPRENHRQLLRFTPGYVLIDAVKKAEKEDCLVVRMHECRGAHTEIELSSDYMIEKTVECNLLEENSDTPQSGGPVRLRLRPFEIKTLKLWLR